MGGANPFSKRSAPRQHGARVKEFAGELEDEGAGTEGRQRSPETMVHPWSEGYRGGCLGKGRSRQIHSHRQPSSRCDRSEQGLVVCTSLGLALPQSVTSPQGLSVGLLDADVYGPSIPRMLNLSGRPELSNREYNNQSSYGEHVCSLMYVCVLYI